jgi:hypothetical protein
MILHLFFFYCCWFFYLCLKRVHYLVSWSQCACLHLSMLSCWGLTYRNFIPTIRCDIFAIGTCTNEISNKFTSSQWTCKELKVNGSVKVHTWTALLEFQSLPPLISYEYSFECRRDDPLLNINLNLIGFHVKFVASTKCQIKSISMIYWVCLTSWPQDLIWLCHILPNALH